MSAVDCTDSDSFKVRLFFAQTPSSKVELRIHKAVSYTHLTLPTILLV